MLAGRHRHHPHVPTELPKPRRVIRWPYPLGHYRDGLLASTVLLLCDEAVIARSLDAYRQSRGNLAVIVVVDSSQPEFPLLYETTFGALGHFGIPFRVADLARGPLSDQALHGCRAFLVAQ